ncbi:hypothetical protein [Nonomuraea sp. bgisy101]|uniref:hypothetical protein n=1 Tax=Nonomuraea sp. bgisy101 TaxID=3413784 RepID=UPI003D75EAF3
MTTIYVDGTTYRARRLRWPHGNPPPTDGCRRCGHRQAAHDIAQLHGRAVMHPYEPPTPAQRSSRAAAREAHAPESRGWFTPRRLG